VGADFVVIAQTSQHRRDAAGVGDTVGLDEVECFPRVKRRHQHIGKTTISRGDCHPDPGPGEQWQKLKEWVIGNRYVLKKVIHTRQNLAMRSDAPLGSCGCPAGVANGADVIRTRSGWRIRTARSEDNIVVILSGMQDRVTDDDDQSAVAEKRLELWDKLGIEHDGIGPRVVEKDLDLACAQTVVYRNPDESSEGQGEQSFDCRRTVSDDGSDPAGSTDPQSMQTISEPA
jgi:hypothetical protein